MKTNLLFIGLGLFLFACSSGEGSIEVQPDAAPLTANGGDKLFTVKVVETPAEGYALDKISVKAKDQAIVCTPLDANANQKLDTGDSLTCIEPAANLFGTDVVGTDIAVELYAGETLIGDATWTPTK